MAISPVVLALALLGSQEGTRDIAYSDLVERMIDLRWLATEPLEGERGYQFSSYDRASHAGKGNADAWYGNRDHGQFLREEASDGQTYHVMADCKGPGVVTRIWSANPQGALRFFVDGDLALEIPFTELCSGAKDPFRAPLCGEHSRGWNCYVPIPFQDHLKILATDNNFYYHVNILQFPQGTRVPSFSTALLQENADALTKVARILERRELYPLLKPEQGLRSLWVSLGPGPGQKAFPLVPATNGPGILRRIALKPKVADLRRFLREARLVVKADGFVTVDCPFGDFFGVAPDFTPYAAHPLGVTQDGTGYCHFPMPFAKGLEISLVNEGTQEIEIEGDFLFEPGDVSHLPLRFHADWHVVTELPTQPRSDFVILDTQGKGRFVGCALTIANPVRNWWGEGDEHFYVDGEDFPSTFGTGTEDYFGYAWCCPDLFQHPYHNQPRCDGPGNYGYTSVNRFHILDQVPFLRSFRFDLEVWHWADCKIDMATTAYWYALPGTHTFTPVAVQQRLAREVPPLPMKRVAGAVEGESMTIIAKSAGDARPQEMAGFGPDWSHESHLWWTDAGEGATLDLELPVAEPGRYEVRAQFTKAIDYGIVQMSIDGTALGEPLDLYNDGVVATGELSIGTTELKGPKALLRLTIAGANPNAVKRYMVGLDYVLLKRIE
ncbi:MAG: glycoside hydrolase family 172 protein [Planctomycetota bacterium]